MDEEENEKKLFERLCADVSGLRIRMDTQESGVPQRAIHTKYAMLQETKGLSGTGEQELKDEKRWVQRKENRE
ncbi:hypothetical protein GCK72_025763 [Caenorhabditis remanei]|uniref:Uncharacterized protein n=2 Tax=Caenorhabditis remanei TaxID=31234 RepID=A0A6A5G326_CAERE|nr:hypothetical protein GCK72_025763 [Caenorhabditis remanei]KAF1749296.1 hypothetical protein GCK72_025763 [Caenorhabditis remanei]